MEKFLTPFLLTFFISVIAIFFLLRAKKSYIRRLGGVVVILVFIFGVLFDKNLVITKPIAGILAGGLLILLFGLWDDLKNLNWKWQLASQIIIAVTAISFGVRTGFITNPFGGAISLDSPAIYLVFYIFYFLLFINSLNWLDGIDGLSGSVTFVSLGIIFFLSLKPQVNQPAVAILSAIAGGAVLGFMVFNFNPAKILAGTSGAWFFGFLLASLSIFAGAKIATVMMAALIPILDFLFVVWERFRAGRSIFVGGDNRHLHFKLLKLGLGERQAVAWVCLASAAVGIAALNLSAPGKLIFILIFSAIYFTVARLINSKIKY